MSQTARAAHSCFGIISGLSRLLTAIYISAMCLNVSFIINLPRLCSFRSIVCTLNDDNGSLPYYFVHIIVLSLAHIGLLLLYAYFSTQ